MTMKTLGIDVLSRDERLNLVEEIWDSIGFESDDIEITEGQSADLRRRLAEYESNPKLGSSWEEVKARLQDQQ